MFDFPQVQAEDMVTTFEHPVAGRYRGFTRGWSFGRTPGPQALRGAGARPARRRPARRGGPAAPQRPAGLGTNTITSPSSTTSMGPGWKPHRLGQREVALRERVQHELADRFARDTGQDALHNAVASAGRARPAQREHLGLVRAQRAVGGFVAQREDDVEFARLDLPQLRATAWTASVAPSFWRAGSNNRLVASICSCSRPATD